MCVSQASITLVSVFPLIPTSPLQSWGGLEAKARKKKNKAFYLINP
jgi:hypothetical protein